MKCPYCDHPNIDGIDTCEKCRASLTDQNLPPPTTAVEKALLRDRVGVLSPKRPFTVSPETTVGEVLRMLIERRIGSVIVVEGERPVGIFSERDALFRLNTDAAWYENRPIRDFMTPNPQCLLADAKIAYAVQRMDLGSFRHVPIVDNDGKLTGVISVRDILGYLTEQMSKG